jgi:hypothetical protein
MVPSATAFSRVPGNAVPFFLSIEMAFKFNNIWIFTDSLRRWFVFHGTEVKYT